MYATCKADNSEGHVLFVAMPLARGDVDEHHFLRIDKAVSGVGC